MWQEVFDHLGLQIGQSEQGAKTIHKKRKQLKEVEKKAEKIYFVILFL
jgi:ABC-type Fe2+-enterobactin transport system substrate-binding protein